MQGSVLGKRSQSSSDSPSCPRDLPTPEVTPTAKRIKTTSTLTDLNPDGNKENIPPIPDSPSPRRPRRTATEGHASPRNPRTPRRHFSTPNLDIRTPSTTLSHLALATPPPTPPSLLVPIYARARALLRSTSNSASPLSGRATERALISEFITSFLDEAKNPASAQYTSLYISGSPGTGKTAVVNSVISESVIPPTFTVITINCMALNDVNFLWSRLVDELSPKAKVKKASKGIDGVNQLLSAYSSKCLLVLDELDHIASSPQSIASIFSVAKAHPSCLRIISIANTHTLTSTSSQVDIQGIAGVRTAHFSPYTSEQLMAILMTRLEPLFNDTVHLKQAEKFLPKTSLTLLSKKIAAQAGDVRSLFEVLRGAIDSASKASTDIALDGPAPIVTPNHVISALKSYAPSSTATASASRNTNAASSSEIVAKVAGLGLQARLSLLTMLLAFKRQEQGLTISSIPTKPSAKVTPGKSALRRANTVPRMSTLDITQLHAYYMKLLSRSNDIFSAVSRTEFVDIVNMLETLGIVGKESNGPSTPSKTSRRTLGRSTSFSCSTKASALPAVAFAEGVRTDEILRGLGVGEQAIAESKGMDTQQEELQAIWIKELRNIRRDIDALTKSKTVVADGFADMTEDD